MTERFCKVEAVRSRAAEPTPWRVEINGDRRLVVDADGRNILSLINSALADRIVAAMNAAEGPSQPIQKFIVEMDVETFRRLAEYARFGRYTIEDEGLRLLAECEHVDHNPLIEETRIKRDA